MRHLINSVTGCVWWWWVLLKEGLFWWTWQIPTLPSGIKLVWHKVINKYSSINILVFTICFGCYDDLWRSRSFGEHCGCSGSYQVVIHCGFNLQICLIYSDLRLETVSIRLLLRLTLLTILCQCIYNTYLVRYKTVHTEPRLYHAQHWRCYSG